MYAKIARAKHRGKDIVLDRRNPAKLYDLLHFLGKGTFGVVWAGTEKSTGKGCAVKIIQVDNDPAEVYEEMKILRECESPYIVDFHGAYEGVEGSIWIIMEHCIGGSINDLVKLYKITLSIEEIRSIVAGVTLGLNYLHKKFIIHRDIKPANILLTADGNIRISDFGVSVKLKNAKERANSAVGAPFWMAPELISEIPYDGRVDVWSLGITIMDLVEGKPPNSHLNPLKALFIIPHQQPPRLKPHERLSPEIHDFLRLCLTKDPKKRMTSKHAVKHSFIRNEANVLETNAGRSDLMQKLLETTIQSQNHLQKGDDETSWTNTVSASTRSLGTRSQSQMSVSDVTKALDSDAPFVQDAVMSKDFIALLKSIYNQDPKVFGNKKPNEWDGADITVAITKALTSILPDEGANSESLASDMDQLEELLFSAPETETAEAPTHLHSEDEEEEMKSQPIAPKVFPTGFKENYGGFITVNDRSHQNQRSREKNKIPLKARNIETTEELTMSPKAFPKGFKETYGGISTFVGRPKKEAKSHKQATAESAEKLGDVRILTREGKNINQKLMPAQFQENYGGMETVANRPSRKSSSDIDV